jgi:hypothetical protein
MNETNLIGLPSGNAREMEGTASAVPRFIVDLHRERQSRLVRRNSESEGGSSALHFGLAGNVNPRITFVQGQG